jgi:hypoxanthine phosphoribosyltransferase
VISRPSLKQALARAELLHDRVAIGQAIRRLGAEIGRDFAGQRPVYLTVLNGGLVFAGHLALEIGIDLEFDTAHLARYQGTFGGELMWLKMPRAELRGKPVLIVDDILDEGRTLAALRHHCETAGATRVAIAVLARKRHDRAVPGLRADYVGLEVPDRYVFGFGMDYFDQGRNLPAIYALPE